MVWFFVCITGMMATGSDLYSAETIAPVTEMVGDFDFQQANRLMLENDVDGAIKLYLAVMSEKETAPLHHNLGVAYYLNGDPGSAVLHFERAVRMGFTSVDTREILSLLRKSEGIAPPRYTLFQRMARTLPEGVWMMLMVSTFWGAVLLGLYVYLLVKRQSLYRDFALGCVFIFFISLIACIGLEQDSHHGVLIGEENGLKVVPTTESEVFLTLKGGEMARQLKTNNGFVFVETSSGVRGWVQEDSFRWIRPRG